jgi:hypothetical protein
MLKDFTRNLFYFFRGPSSDDDPAHERQLENNLTKSLIVVLEHADREFLQAFAQRLGLAPPDGRSGSRFNANRSASRWHPNGLSLESPGAYLSTLTLTVQLFPRETWCDERNGVLLHPRDDLLHVPLLLLGVRDFGWNYDGSLYRNFHLRSFGKIARRLRHETAVAIDSSYVTRQHN